MDAPSIFYLAFDLFVNFLKLKQLDKNRVVANFATTAADGKSTAWKSIQKL